MQPIVSYPVRVNARLDPRLSRWLWLIKWLLAIPHYILLFFLWIAFLLVSIVAFFTILITAHYPRALFTFNLGVLRWTWRVGYYTYAALGTDHYPPFTLAHVDGYPAHLHIPYPDHLSRGLVLIKWWLLAIPHYLVLVFFLGGGYTLARYGDTIVASFGLIGLLVLFAALALLATGRYPPGLYNLILGMNRWTLRVTAYAALMTDTYPPFRLDQGGTDPGSPTPAGDRPQRVAGGAAMPAEPVRLAREPLPLWAMALLGAAATAVLSAAVWAAVHLQSDHALRTGALFVHLVALVVGFGAVIAVDWFALLWLLGRRSLPQLTNVASAAHLPIWLGLLGLVLSGALLRPDLTVPLTWIKLGLVLLVTLNGLHAYAVGERLLRWSVAGNVPRGLLRHAGGTAAVSQLGWWGAMIIGFINTQ